MSDERVATMAWQASGAWQGGTVSSVALIATHEGGVRLMAGGRAGLFLWQDGRESAAPLDGLDDPRVTALAVAGDVVLAGTEGGRLYRIGADLAGAWHELLAWGGLGLPTALAPSPSFAADGDLFVGTANGIFRTLDGGATWESCEFGLLDLDILCLACAPDYATSQLLWAGSSGGGLYRSRNSGRAWRDAGMGLLDAPVQALAVTPDFAASRTLYAGLEEHGVYVSRDGGDSWQSYGLAGKSVNSLALDGAGRVLAGCEDGLVRADLDGTWQSLGAPTEVVLTVAVRGDLIAVGAKVDGVALSIDGGQSWKQPALALHAPPLVATATSQDWMALDADGALAHTQDAGKTWRALPDPDLDGVFGIHGGVDAGSRPVYFAATGVGVCRWDGGDGWVLVADAVFHDHTALAVELAPDYGTDAALLVVGHDGTLFLSPDDGADWRDITGPWTNQTLLQAHFVMLAEGRRRIVALSALPTESGHFGVTVWQSDDSGGNWESLASLSTGVPALIMVAPARDAQQALFLATQHRVVKIYVPEGESEPAVHQHFFAEDTRVTALAASPTYALDGRLWVTTSGGVFRSGDRGMTWSAAGAGPGGAPLVALVPGEASLVAVALGGQTWQATL